MHRTTPATAVLGLSLALVLTGCFANPLDGLVEGLVEGGVEQLIEDQTGVDVDINGTGASLPDGWPSEVPVPNGTIVVAAASQGTFVLTITSPSLNDAESAYQQLLANGFTETASFDAGEGNKSYAAEDDAYNVTMFFGPNDDGTATVQITVAPQS